jgi:hypothetical protein
LRSRSPGEGRAHGDYRKHHDRGQEYGTRFLAYVCVFCHVLSFCVIRGDGSFPPALRIANLLAGTDDRFTHYCHHGQGHASSF